MDEGKSTTFVVKFSNNVARYVEESHFYTDIAIHRETNGDIIFQTTVKSETEFLRWVRSFVFILKNSKLDFYDKWSKVLIL